MLLLCSVPQGLVHLSRRPSQELGGPFNLSGWWVIQPTLHHQEGYLEPYWLVPEAIETWMFQSYVDNLPLSNHAFGMSTHSAGVCTALGSWTDQCHCRSAECSIAVLQLMLKSQQGRIRKRSSPHRSCSVILRIRTQLISLLSSTKSSNSQGNVAKNCTE